MSKIELRVWAMELAVEAVNGSAAGTDPIWLAQSIVEWVLDASDAQAQSPGQGSDA